MKNPKGLTIYHGPSLLDRSQHIMVVATLSSSNEKTGDMVQTWILRDDSEPHTATNTRQDYAICGNCPHRKQETGKRTCYVQTHNAPLSVYRSFHKGNYPMYEPEKHDHLLKDRAIRFGAYGDPAAAPTHIWRNLATLASIRTGYTHQVNHPSTDPELLSLVMASADSPKQADKLNRQGARTFRVMNPGDTLRANEVECLADSHGMQCLDCGLCDGASNKPSIAITVHGAQASNFKTANVIARSN
jgi:hypothetical protein